jgi:bla regulator protein blaR1
VNTWIIHVWQSTLFAVAAGVLTVGFKRNHARVRYWLWFSASIKFLLPFSLLMTIGSALPWRLATPPASPVFSSVMTQIGQPFLDVGSPTAAAPSPATADSGWIAVVILAIWACGAGAVLRARFTTWGQFRRALRTSTPVAFDHIALPAGVRMRATSSVLEPGVIGFWRPVILIPAGIERHLTPSQLEAVLAHEICHIRHRDNLLAMLHMAVETIFWFHPLVWWIGGRLIDERERACDEDVLRLHGAPRTYAEGIIRVCERYVDARLACVAGVSGSDLKKRIEAIMRNQTAERLSTWKSAVLLSAAAAIPTIPIVIGTFDSPRLQAQAQEQTRTAGDLAFDVATIRPNKTGRGFEGLGFRQGRFSATGVSLRELLTSAYDLQAFEIFGEPTWATSDRFDIAATMPPPPTGTDAPDAASRNRGMLRSLLAERFKLVVHEERRDMPVYALVLARPDRKLGAQLRAFQGECWDSSRPGPEPEAPTWPQPPSDSSKGPQWCISMTGVGRISSRGTVLPDLARVLATFPAVRRRVIDRTGLTGRFDFDMEWTPLATAGPAAPGVPPDAGPTLFTALQEQLGLKLESTKATIGVLVIDSVSQPSPN